jgi:hypothetical protein
MKDSQIIEKSKYVMQTANEKWDSMEPIARTLILCLGILVFLIKIPVLVGLVVVCGLQRIFYHLKYYKDKDDDLNPVSDEPVESHGVKTSIKEDL